MPADIVESVQRLGILQNLSAPLQTALFSRRPGPYSESAGVRDRVYAHHHRAGIRARAVTSQDIPGNQVLMGLSLFLTLFVMGPTWDELDGQAT